MKPVTGSKRSLRVKHRYTAPPARVFDAWLDREVAGRWLFATASSPIADVEIDPRAGGSFRFTDRGRGEIVEYAGKYLEVRRHRRLVFSLAIGPRRRHVGRVSVEIAPRARGCELTLTHANVPREQAHDIEGRWSGILYGLGVTLHQQADSSTTITTGSPQ